MNPIDRPIERRDWESAQAEGTAVPAPVPKFERRDRTDRRSRILWSIVYGSFNPRRRRPPRRAGESRFHSLDWHSSHLLAVSIGILLLSVADAFMTVRLLAGGAVEVNPVMAAVVYRSAAAFAALKMMMTGVSVTLMVLLARYRFMRMVRVDVVMYLVFAGYVALLAYECRLAQSLLTPFEF